MSDSNPPTRSTRLPDVPKFGPEDSDQLDTLMTEYIRSAAERTAVSGKGRGNENPNIATLPAAHLESEAPRELRSTNLPPIPLNTRYHELGFLGRGGVGEVYRVRDRELFRTVALKVLQSETLSDETMIERFIDEAQVTAQLEHPGIVPVHDLGRLPDGRVYFTMKEVRGRTLQDVIREVHEPPATGPAFPFRRLVHAFHRVCESIAYAHARGVVHRDIKPQNIMIGEYGEVLVLDWGLAKVLYPEDKAPPSGSRPSTPVFTRSQHAGKDSTPIGHVAGTLAYMSLEQALGETERIGPASDVYSLGAVLFEILTGEPPFLVLSLRDLLKLLIGGHLTPPRRLIDTRVREGRRKSPPLPIPEELEAICLKAMARDPEDRFPDAKRLADEIASWLEGSKRRAQALNIVSEADALRPLIARLREQASEKRKAAKSSLEGIRPHEPTARKEHGWAIEDEAAELTLRAETLQIEYVQKLYMALNHVPELPEASERLADYFREVHARAEAERDVLAAVRFEALLRVYDRGKHAAYLQGNGAVTLITDPPGATVALYRYVERGRRLLPEFIEMLGTTPLIIVPLPKGNYLLELRAEGRVLVRYPISLDRQEHWDGIRPGGSTSFPIHLPKEGELGPDELYVPAGWFRSGGDPGASNALSWRRLWVDGFVMKRFPVTNGEYIEFLNDLVATGREEEALRHAPRERAGREGERGALIYGRDPRGMFFLTRDVEGNSWLPNHPVLMIDWYCANAYARWLSEKTGLAYRLPGEWEWEKAARSVDGRFLPWGDFLDPTWACMQDSHAGKPLPATVDSHPIDESPYGIRGLGGNVRDWCADVYQSEGAPVSAGGLVLPPEPPGEEQSEAHRVLRGGAWVLPARDARSASRGTSSPTFLFPVLGFRLVRSL